MYIKTFFAQFDFAVDVDGLSGSTHECVRLELPYIIYFLSMGIIFHKKFFLSGKQKYSCIEMAGNVG